MTKEEYKWKKAEIVGKMAELNHSLDEMKKEYICSNVKIPVGSIVYLVTPEYIGFNDIVPEEKRKVYISEYEVYLDGIIIPILFKVKNDGKPSKVRDYLWTFQNQYLEEIKNEGI